MTNIDYEILVADYAVKGQRHHPPSCTTRSGTKGHDGDRKGAQEARPEGAGSPCGRQQSHHSSRTSTSEIMVHYRNGAREARQEDHMVADSTPQHEERDMESWTTSATTPMLKATRSRRGGAHRGNRS